ncbi:MAG: ribosome-associated translation inhibitor RaiA [Proteobacteria bacterium]|nr:ribosome-associated translation inhibitor RaiA [Pseudomonadota bacterium]
MSNQDNLNISVTFRHTESTPALKSHAVEKVGHCVGKYISNSADIHVILSVEKRDHVAEVKVKSKEYDVTAKAVTEDLYSSVDKVIDNIEAQIRKQKDKIKSHKHSPEQAL